MEKNVRFDVLGEVDGVTEGGDGVICELLGPPLCGLGGRFHLICTPYESKSVGPVTLTVQSVCVL